MNALPCCSSLWKGSSLDTISCRKPPAWPSAATCTVGRHRFRKEDGFLRLVWGLGTGAAEFFGDEHPRLVALSHPLLQPADSVEEICQHSQQCVDLIDLEKNALRTFPVREVLEEQYPILRYVAQVEAEGYLSSLNSSMVDINPAGCHLRRPAEQNLFCQTDERLAYHP